jgi:hypothetical protein
MTSISSFSFGVILQIFFMWAVILSARAQQTCTAPETATVTMSNSMEGALHINPGDSISAGYHFTMPGSHPACTVEAAATVTMHCKCGDGSQQNVDIHMPCQQYTVPANDGGWYASGDQNSQLTYQGSAVLGNVCGSSTAQCDASQGATFTGYFGASVLTHDIHVQFQ